jgi:hypothetical protein
MALHQVADQARGLHDPGRGDRRAQITTKHALENGMEFDTDLMDTLG